MLPKKVLFSQESRGSARAGRGGVLPRLLRHMGRGVIPSSKNSGRGGKGLPPPPLSAKRLLFCTAEILCFAWNHDVITNLVRSPFLVRGGRFGPEGEGYSPICSGTWGGG